MQTTDAQNPNAETTLPHGALRVNRRLVIFDENVDDPTGTTNGRVATYGLPAGFGSPSSS
eukprot:3383995-Lingulodinium_polyedra.AAC.1